jgi:FkbM family methyltransferase
MLPKVIIDLGAHKGEDSDFYLRKGFKVIAVEASDKLCEIILQRFKNHPNAKNFKILNYAITDKDNEVIEFYENVDNSVWGTVFESWAERNKKLGTTSIKKYVKTIRLDTLIQNEIKKQEYLEYVKIDIEGADLIALKTLFELQQKPKFLSIESEKISWKKLIEEFRILKELGYTKFKIVDQEKVQYQQCPFPSKEGDYLDYKFEEGSSGLFGDDLPNNWLNDKEAINIYKRIFFIYRYFGDYGLLNNKFFMKNRHLNKIMDFLNLKYPHASWYDTHATY